jgi:glycosyltransferase involved in cell wall biosynthesis
MRLDLSAANAIQTYNTVKELRLIIPRMRLVVPRWLNEPSAFEDLRAMHLPRPAVNKLSRLVRWVGWSYIERTLFSLMLVILLAMLRLWGSGYRVLYVRDAVCAGWLCLLAPVHGARVVYEVHDLESAHPSRAFRWPERFWRSLLSWHDRLALTRSCVLVSLTQTFKQWVVRRGLRAEGDVVVIPDAFDPELHHPADAQAARRNLGLPQDARIVAYAGLTFAYRGVDLLVRAFAHLQEQVAGSMLVLVGGRPHEIAELRALAARLGITPRRLIMTGHLPHAATLDYLNAADVLVIPNTVTTLTASPLKLFEYMAVGKPIVCKDSPALREIVDESSAVFFTGGNEQALAAALRRVLSDPALGRTLGASALRRAERYTYCARAARIAEVVYRCS